jgi:hypothetical protein
VKQREIQVVGFTITNKTLQLRHTIFANSKLLMWSEVNISLAMPTFYHA